MVRAVEWTSLPSAEFWAAVAVEHAALEPEGAIDSLSAPEQAIAPGREAATAPVAIACEILTLLYPPPPPKDKGRVGAALRRLRARAAVEPEQGFGPRVGVDPVRDLLEVAGRYADLAEEVDAGVGTLVMG